MTDACPGPPLSLGPPVKGRREDPGRPSSREASQGEVAPGRLGHSAAAAPAGRCGDLEGKSSFWTLKQSPDWVRGKLPQPGSGGHSPPPAPDGLVLLGASRSRYDADPGPKPAAGGPPPAADPRRDLPRCESTHRPRSCRLLRDTLAHLRPRRHLRPIASKGARKKRCLIDSPPTNFARPPCRRPLADAAATRSRRLIHWSGWYCHSG